MNSKEILKNEESALNYIYCPKCGELSPLPQHVTLEPGEIFIKCPQCGTRWRIWIEFYESGGE